jgi:hypothetical protein
LLIRGLDGYTQNYNSDTVIVEGFLITYVEKNSQKSFIDLTNGQIFLFYNSISNKKKPKSKSFFEMDKKQNAIFLFENGGNFLTLNTLFFNKSLKALNLNKENFPNYTNYNFKDKKYYYKFTFVKIKCIRIFMYEKDLIHFTAFDQYHFDLDCIPVYIIQEILD